MADPRDTALDWDQLLPLLEPIHAPCRLFARRIAGSNADGDDLFHEALLRAAAKLHTLRDRDRFRPWLHQVIVSVHRSRSRRGFWRRLVRSSGAPAGDPDHDGPGPEREPVGEDGAAWAEQHASAERAASALATLPASQREAVVLFELFGYSAEEVAEIQRSSLSAVKSRLSRGRARLRRFYIALGDALPEDATPTLPLQEECRG